MADELKLADAPSTSEAPAAEVTAPEGEAAPADPATELAQLRAEKAKLQAELTKRENDWKSVRGTIRKDLKAQADTELLRQEIVAMNDTLAAVITEFSGDEEAPKKLAAIKARQQERVAEARKTTEGQARAILDQIGRQIAVAHKVNFRTEPKKVQEFLETDPAWADVATLVSEAWNSQSLDGLQTALDRAEEVREALQEQRIEKARAEARKEAEEEARAKLTKAGVFSTAASTMAVGTGKRTQFTEEEIEAGGSDFIQRHFAEIKAAQREGRIRPRGG